MLFHRFREHSRLLSLSLSVLSEVLEGKGAHDACINVISLHQVNIYVYINISIYIIQHTCTHTQL